MSRDILSYTEEIYVGVVDGEIKVYNSGASVDPPILLQFS